MLRKHTSFFDSTLEYIGDNTQCFEYSTELHDKLVDLIRNISILGEYTPVSVLGHKSESENKRLLVGFLNKLNATITEYGAFGYDMGEEFTSEFLSAAQKVYRLETIFKFPWEEPGGNTMKRKIVMHFVFYEKGSKKSFFWIKFYFNEDGLVFHIEDSSHTEEPKE